MKGRALGKKISASIRQVLLEIPGPSVRETDRLDGDTQNQPVFHARIADVDLLVSNPARELSLSPVRWVRLAVSTSRLAQPSSQGDGDLIRERLRVVLLRGAPCIIRWPWPCGADGGFEQGAISAGGDSPGYGSRRGED